MPESLVSVHQALYGYVEGHRLLGGSTRLDEAAQRTLRSLTDVAFDGKARSYLTICPLPSQQAHAFIKTWPADPWTRPGSVWSHVLLVDLPNLGRLQGLRGIAEAFRRPMPTGLVLDLNEVAGYQHSLTIPADQFIRMRSSPTDAPLVASVLHGLYDSNEPVRVRVPDASRYEDLLLAVFEQQWPRLRRNFSCRTRQRSTSVQMDLELVEQVPGRDAPRVDAKAISHGWASVASADLGKADARYRRFLQICGAESSSGRRDFRPLTQMYEAVSSPNGAPDVVLNLIASNFPDPEEQRGLKRVLFANVENSSREQARLPYAPAQWPRAEKDRIPLAVRAARWLDLAQVDLGARLVDLYRTEPDHAQLPDLDLELLSVRNVEALVGGITSRADPDTAVAVAISQPDLGLLIAAQNKQILASPAIWEHLDVDLLIELLDESKSVGLREFVLDQLLDQNADAPIASICGADSDGWWALLLRSARRDDASFFQRANTLRASLVRLGTAALNSPPVRPQNARELMTLLLAAELTSGLWRRAAPEDWTRAAGQVLGRENDGTPRSARERLMAVALVSAIQSGSAEHRTRGWRTCYPYLYAALRSETFDAEAWALLASTLPAGAAWDKCNRLRRGVAQEIKKDRWSADGVRAVVNASSPDSGALIALLEERSAKKKKDHWLKQMLKMFT